MQNAVLLTTCRSQKVFGKTVTKNFFFFEVRHPRCVGSITKESLCTAQAV